MNKNSRLMPYLLLFIAAQNTYSADANTQLAVWANEAIIATYSYDYKNYLQEQKEIAKYFTADGWMNYTKALNDSKLPDSVQKNNYFVSAVATLPPEIKKINDTYWQATMPILVLYTNPQNRQKQNLKVVLTFSQAASGQGVRGYNINSLQSTVIQPPCQCANEPLEEIPDSNAKAKPDTSKK